MQGLIIDNFNLKTNSMKNLFLLSVLLLVVMACGGGGSDPNLVVSVVDCKFTVTPGVATTVNTQLTFTDNSTTTNGKITTWAWDFGDNFVSFVQNPYHTYPYPGIYTVKLTATNALGTNDYMTKTITVTDPSGTSLKGLRKWFYMHPDTVLVVAHRALHLTEAGGSYAAENSMTAINGAIANHIDQFECDVRETSDGVLVLMHDPTIDRTTNGTGTLANMTYAQLKSLKLKMYGSTTLTTDTIPTLQQVLTTAKGKIFITLDIDDKAPAMDVLAMVKQMDMVDDVIFFTSHQEDAASLIQSGAMPLPSCYSTSSFNSYVSNHCKPLVFQVDNTGYSSYWPVMKSAGCRLYDNVYLLTTTLPTGNGWSQLTPDLQNGVTMVQTDYPIEMINYLKTIHKH
jgi:glycerophosphoryl diester phosphodiesterase